MIPYAPSRMYEDRSNIGDLILRAGENKARGLREGGQIWGQAIGNLGQIAGGTLRDIAEGRAAEQASRAKAEADRPRLESEQKLRDITIRKGESDLEQVERERRRTEEFDGLLSGEKEPTAKDLIRVLGARDGAAAWGALQTTKPDVVKRFTDKQEVLKKGLLGVAAVPEAARAKVYEGLRQNYLSQGLITDQDAPAQYDPEWFSQALNFGEKPKEVKEPGTRQVEITNPDGSKTVRIVPDTAGQEFKSFAPPKAAAVDDSEFEDTVQNLMTGHTADKVSIKVRDKARAEASRRGGVDGTGFVPANTTQQAAFSELRDLERKASRLEELLQDPEVKGRLGPGMGSWTELTKELPVLGSSTKVKEAFDLMANLSDTVLRERTGAASSVPEYNRIIGFGVSPTKQLDSNLTNLKHMREATQEALSNMGAKNLNKATPSRKEGESYIEYLKRTNPGG